MARDPLKAAKEAVETVGEVLKIAGSNPDARQAGAELGKAALTVTKTINNALLPLAAINFAFDKAKAYFADKFGDEMAERVASVPQDKVIEPKASIAGPALQGLAFSHEEPDLKALYLTLLATAMDSRIADQAHPAFVEIIRQLEAQEARLLPIVLKRAGGIPIAEIRVYGDGGGWQMRQRYLIAFTHGDTDAPVEVPNVVAMVDNWIRLGLVSVEYGKYLMGEKQYDWVPERPEYKRFEADIAAGRLGFERGILAPTALGKRFGAAVGLLDGPTEASVDGT